MPLRQPCAFAPNASNSGAPKRHTCRLLWCIPRFQHFNSMRTIACRCAISSVLSHQAGGRDRPHANQQSRTSCATPSSNSGAPANDFWCITNSTTQSASSIPHLQMTVVHPSVSTEGSVRTIAWRCAILRVPNARQVVTTAGRPSGMAATASATAILK